MLTIENIFIKITLIAYSNRIAKKDNLANFMRDSLYEILDIIVQMCLLYLFHKYVYKNILFYCTNLHTFYKKKKNVLFEQNVMIFILKKINEDNKHKKNLTIVIMYSSFFLFFFLVYRLDDDRSLP